MESEACSRAFSELSAAAHINAVETHRQIKNYLKLMLQFIIIIFPI